MGTDCKSAAFSFGGSNPPAPTKDSGIQWVPEFLFYQLWKRGCKGGFEQHRPAEWSGGEKSPCGAFLDARLAQSTRAHQKASTYTSTLRFLFCDEVKLTERVDSNSCGAVAEDSAKTAQWAVFSSAAREIHPRPPRTPVSNGYRSFCFISFEKGDARVDSNSSGADRRLRRKQGGEAGAALRFFKALPRGCGKSGKRNS